MSQSYINVIGAGLAGWKQPTKLQSVVFQLNFMKCVVSSQHHNTKTDNFELVCSNPAWGCSNAVGLLKEEMRRLTGLESAEATRVRWWCSGG